MHRDNYNEPLKHPKAVVMPPIRSMKNFWWSYEPETAKKEGTNIGDRPFRHSAFAN
jgi:hypothetical protein